MKKFKLFMLSLIVVSAVALAGCDDDDDRKERELNNKIDQLERELDSLKEKSSGNNNSTAETSVQESSDAGNSGAENNDSTKETSVKTNDSEDTIESLTAAVDEVTKKADSAVPSDSLDEKRSQFIELKDEINSVERRLDIYEDYIESMYKRGEISYDDYRSKDMAVEELEDKLDASEDKLEFSFGIDD